MFDVKQLYGLSIESADRIVKLNNYDLKIGEYVSLKGKMGSDPRVIRASFNNETVTVVVGWFNTDIVGANNE